MSHESLELVVIGVLIGLAMILMYRLIHRDPTVSKTRWGVFVERDRYPDDDEDAGWPERPPGAGCRPVAGGGHRRLRPRDGTHRRAPARIEHPHFAGKTATSPLA